MSREAKDNSLQIPPGRRGFTARQQRYRMLEEWYGKERAANEIAAHTSQVRQWGSLLDEVLNKTRRPENLLLVRLRSEWSRIIGSSFSRFCEPQSLREGVLTLAVKHSALLVELKPSCDILCQRINREMGQEVCREIRLVV